MTHAVANDGSKTTRAETRAADSSMPNMWYPFALGLATVGFVEPVLGAPYLSIARWLADFEAWPVERRRAWQQQRLARVLMYARTHVPFFRERLGKAAAEVPLTKLPVIDKQRIRDAESAFRSNEWRDLRTIPKKTGGSGGDPFHYPLDRVAWAHMYGARLHAYGRHGYRYGERILMLGAPESLGVSEPSWKTKLRHVVERTDASLTGFRLDQEVSLERARAAEAKNAALWYGYAGTIAAMAQAVLEAGVRIRGPRVIVTTAEALHPSWRDRIRRAFGSFVYDDYGCNDGGIYAQSCDRGRFHVAENVSIVEVVDDRGRTCPAGEEGEIVVTNLHAKALPFIRYAVGDRAVARDKPCPCGRDGVVLERLAGRSWDQIVLPQGRRLSAMTFWPVFRETPHVRRWQVVQRHERHLTVRLDVTPSFTQEEGRVLESYFRDRCEGVKVDLTTREPIETTTGGKHRAVVRSAQ